jgi:MFS family permease
VTDKVAFISFSFLWKFLCGVGAGINSVASMAIVANHYKDERERVIGLIEAASGVGLLLGPFFGALLYEIGGYMLPFVATAATYFLLYPLIALSLAVIHEEELEDSKRIASYDDLPEQDVFELCKIPRFLFGLFS